MKGNEKPSKSLRMSYVIVYSPDTVRYHHKHRPKTNHHREAGQPDGKITYTEPTGSRNLARSDSLVWNDKLPTKILFLTELSLVKPGALPEELIVDDIAAAAVFDM